MFFTYVLFSERDGKLYVGYSCDIDRRFAEHAAGHVPSTKDRRPLRLLYYEAYLTERKAKRREHFLKGGAGRAQLKEQLIETFKEVGYRFRKSDSPSNAAPVSVRVTYENPFR